MKKILIVLIILSGVYLYCNEPPVVSNIIVEQRDDGSYLVDIYYDLEDADGDSMLVSVSASDDEGISWNYVIVSVEGDIGNDIVSGNGKQVIWDFAVDHPEVLNIPTMIRITADDRNGEGIESMIFVEGGLFEMGDQFNEGNDDELPVHNVTLSNFYIGQYEVTQGEYEAVMGSNPAHSYGVGDYYPVYYVTWYNAVQYCNALSEIEGLTPCYNLSDWSCDFSVDGYRLPTEAEWEYAARGGLNWEDNYRYSGTTDNLGDYAWYYNNSGSQTHEVGTKEPNQLNIYDMSGNVCEWCNDWYSSSYYGSSPSSDPTGPDNGSERMVRDGFWNNYASYCRVADRHGDHPSTSQDSVGFRILRTAE
ncbi:MAG: formylglycine-generating enzyme family protein [Candidatus Cloacimonetes bacterium]|nr:formylglycine-generating enzyme family protein [Candidatus Cloacimonadota bacterium]